MQLGSQWTKLVTLIFVAGGAILLGALGRITEATTSTLLAACLGYVFGNGHGVMEAKQKPKE